MTDYPQDIHTNEEDDFNAAIALADLAASVKQFQEKDTMMRKEIDNALAACEAEAAAIDSAIMEFSTPSTQ